MNSIAEENHEGVIGISFRRSKLSTTYMYPIMAVILILPLLLTVYDAIQNKSRLLAELRLNADQLMNISASASEDAFWSYNDTSLELIAEAVAEFKEVAVINILDENGRVIYGIIKEGERYSDRYRYPAFIREIFRDKIKIGEIHIVYTTYYLNQQIRAEIFLSLARTIIISLITLAIVYLLTRNITTSLDNIGLGVKSFSEGDRSSRIYVKDNHEIRHLAERINLMFRTIVESDIKLQDNYIRLQNQEEALRVSEERFRYAVEGSNDAIWDWNLDTNDFYVSARGAQMAGLAEHETIDLITWISLIHPQDRNQFEYFMNGFVQNPDTYRQLQFRILDQKGEIRWLFCRGKGILDQNKSLLRVSGFYTDITERIKAEEEIHHLAYYDVLTGLPNRAMFFDQVNKILLNQNRQQQNGSLLFMDLDDFKTVNDTKGHATGDKLLIRLANELHDNISHDLIARIGGDEFVFILQSSSLDQSMQLAGEILNLVKKPRTVGDAEFILSCSIGIVTYPEDGADIDTLLMRADSAMYHAKMEGKNQYKFYDQSINDRMLQKVKMQNEIRQGIINREFILYYQPQIDLLNGNFVGVEALVRWQHPELGLLMPGNFIGLAEETGLILPLSEYILKNACLQSILWEQQGLSNLKMSVNISAKQVNSKSIVEEIQKVIDETGMNPENLILEITESVAMDNIEHTIEVMNQLKEKGISFSLDDFGTGYSSLNYLKNIPIQHLKIDKQFVQSLGKQAFEDVVVRAIIEIAHSMELVVVAEGIETPEQQQALISYNCDLAQGYYFSRPIPVQEAEAYLKKGSIGSIRNIKGI